MDGAGCTHWIIAIFRLRITLSSCHFPSWQFKNRNRQLRCKSWFRFLAVCVKVAFQKNFLIIGWVVSSLFWSRKSFRIPKLLSATRKKMSHLKKHFSDGRSGSFFVWRSDGDRPALVCECVLYMRNRLITLSQKTPLSFGTILAEIANCARHPLNDRKVFAEKCTEKRKPKLSTLSNWLSNECVPLARAETDAWHPDTMSDFHSLFHHTPYAISNFRHHQFRRIGVAVASGVHNCAHRVRSRSV